MRFRGRREGGDEGGARYFQFSPHEIRATGVRC